MLVLVVSSSREFRSIIQLKSFKIILPNKKQKQTKKKETNGMKKGKKDV